MSDEIKAARDLLSKANIAALKKSISIDEGLLAAAEKAASGHQALIEGLNVNPGDPDSTHEAILANVRSANMVSMHSRDSMTRTLNRLNALTGEAIGTGAEFQLTAGAFPHPSP